MFDSDSIQSKASVYTDFQGLTDLKRQARENSDAALEKVARQFESLFVQMMMKSMREASDLGGGLMDNQQTRMFQDMYDKQLATSLSESSGGIGLAEVLIRQLKGLQGAQGVENSTQLPPRQPFVAPRPPVETFAPAAPAPVAPAAAAEPDPAPEVSKAMPAEAVQAPSAAATEDDRFDSPESFVTRLWPYAEKAAERLGVEPRVLIAQAALETGWGKSVIRGSEGQSSFNLFNIKADHRWPGASIAKQTLEYHGGVARMERAPFRAYGSFAESFEDYVEFLRANPRYRDALEHAAQPDTFVRKLHEAGYATDPDYARKIEDIMRRSVIDQTLAASSAAGDGTLS